MVADSRKGWMVMVAVLALMAAPAAAQETVRDLVVTGRAEVRVVPDVATIQVAVLRQGKEAAGPRREAAERLDAVIKAARAAGVAERDLRSGGVQVHPEWEWDKGRRLRGFTARAALELQVRDFAVIGDLLTAFARAGADEIGEVQFGVADPRAVEREALTAAMADARRKAEALAAAAGVRLGEVLQIGEVNVELPGPVPAPRARAMALETAEAPVPVAPGASVVPAAVVVRWALR